MYFEILILFYECFENENSNYFNGKFKLSSILLVIVMVHHDVVTKTIASKDVKLGDVWFDIGTLFTNKQESDIHKHMF